MSSARAPGASRVGGRRRGNRAFPSLDKQAADQGLVGSREASLCGQE